MTKEINVKLAGLAFVLLLAILGVSHLNAQNIYTWTDAKGVTHITDQPPPQNATVEDVVKFKEKSPQELEAIEHRKEQLRKWNERQDKIEAARRAEAEARQADRRAEEAMQRAQDEYEYNQDYVRALGNRRWKRRKFRKRIEGLKLETEATQAEAQAAAQQAEEAAKKTRDAAAKARESQ
jgi:hypothetical protein